MNNILVPKEKLKTHDDEPDKKKTPSKNKKESKCLSTVIKTQTYYFKDFRKLCMHISEENSHLQKMAIIKKCFDDILSNG